MPIKKPIRPDSWRKRSSIMESQVELFCLLIDDLEESFSHPSNGPISEHPAYQRFLLGAYALGFVCEDLSHDGRYLSRAKREGWIESRSFLELRRYIHTLVRAERATSEVIDEGLGHIEDALRSRVLQRVGRALRSNSEWREVTPHITSTPQETPPFAGTLPDAHETYLGSVDVVEQLVREFLYDVSMASDVDTITAAVNRFATIFCGLNPEYQPVPGWNERLQLGVVMAARLGVDINQDWESVMRTGLVGFALEIKHIIEQHADSPDEDWEWKIDGLIEFWTSLLVGTVDITHPEAEDV